MPAGLSSSDDDDLLRAEHEIQQRLGDLEIDLDSLAAISNIFRVANSARYHFERSALVDFDLSFTAFTVLWVLWVWGERESRHVAAEAGISKGTLTGVVGTLERRNLVRRRNHPADRRLVLVDVTVDGAATMAKVFPLFNAEEAHISGSLTTAEKQALAVSLRKILRTLESL